MDCDVWERESLFHISGRDEGTKTSSASRENGSVVLSNLFFARGVLAGYGKIARLHDPVLAGERVDGLLLFGFGMP